jgi:hypothetical protein
MYTGWDAVKKSTSFLDHASQASGVGSGSSSVLFAVIASLLVAMIMYFIQGIMKPKEAVKLT